MLNIKTITATQPLAPKNSDTVRNAPVKPSSQKVIKKNFSEFTNYKNVIGMLNPIEAVTAEEMTKQAGFDFVAKKVPISYDTKNGPWEVPDKMSIIRSEDESYISTMGADYNLYQYPSMFEFTEVLVEQEGASYIAGKTICNGAKAFLLMKTNDCFKLGMDDDIDCYFYVSSSHDGSISLDITPVPLRRKGNMLLSLPSNMGKGFRFKHTKNMNQRVSGAKAGLKKIQSYWEAAARDLTLFANAKLSDSQADEYISLIIPEAGDSKAAVTRCENSRADIKTIYLTNPICQVPTCKGTLAGVYFAACLFHEHFTTARKSSVRNEVDNRILSLLDGGVHEKKAKAYAMARIMADRLGGTFR